MYNVSRKNVIFKTVNINNINEIQFNSAYPTGDSNVDKGRALLYESQNTDKGVVFIHGLGSRNFEYLKYYPENLSQHNFTSIMLVLPYHFERMPKNQKIDFLSGTAENIEKRFYQSVVDAMTCVDYLQKIGIKTINIMGYSFGGMISVIAMALDKRINKGAFVVSGGNFENITWKSVATKVLRVRYEDEDSCNMKKCEQIHKSFDYDIRNFSDLKDLYNLPSCFRYDPSLFAKFIDPKKVIMFNAIFDSFIPKKSSKDLWIRLRQPKQYKLPAGHLTSHLWFKKYILNRTLNFFN